MFDFTKEIALEENWKKRYSYLRLLVLFIFLLIGIYVLARILFPSASFDFFFDTPNATKNTLVNPRKNDGSPYQNGSIEKEAGLIFNAGVVGNFSNSETTISLEKNYFKKVKGILKARKSFQAFFYPEGDPMSFKNGSLLKNNSTYFIVSANTLRPFSSESVVSDLGFNKKAFVEISPEELSLNKKGYDISKTDEYPEDSLFRIGDEYLTLKEKKLSRFVSEKAYLTKHSPEQAIEKDLSFLEKYELSEDFVGFADGTLLSFDNSVFIVSGSNIYPVYDPTTFESMGYIWDEIIPANSEEISIYEKQRIFTVANPHPEGTIFFAKDSGKYYYIKDKQKRPLIGNEILRSYLRMTPITAEEKSLETYVSCEIKPTFRLLGKYGCDILLEEINGFLGNNFQFEAVLEDSISAKTLHSDFHQVLSTGNMKTSLFLLKKRILDNYSPQ